MNVEQPDFGQFELSEEEQKIVESFERLPFLHIYKDSHEVDLLLVWQGLKPATEIDLGKVWGPGEKERILTDDEIREATVTLRGAGLHVSEPVRERNEAKHVTEDERFPEEVPYDEPGYDKATIYVSKSPDHLQQVLKAAEGIQKDDPSAEIKYGRLMGYPKSAVDAYGRAVLSDELYDFERETLLREDLPEDIREQDYAAFATFRLSKDNWQEEIETARKWAEEIKRLNPNLYHRIVAAYRGS